MVHLQEVKVILLDETSTRQILEEHSIRQCVEWTATVIPTPMVMNLVILTVCLKKQQIQIEQPVSLTPVSSYSKYMSSRESHIYDFLIKTVIREYIQ